MRFLRFVFVRVGLLATLAAMFFGSSTRAMGQSEWVVHSFNSPFGVQGVLPMGNLVADSAGNLYGTTLEGGASGGWGTVYELVRPAPPKTAWTEVVLYSFTGGADGGDLVAGVVFDKAGNLYGTSRRGGTSGNGVVFELLTPSTVGGKWSETVLHTFQPTSGDGASPIGELTLDGAGNLYGITNRGGANQGGACDGGCGTVFQLSPPSTLGGAWTENILHSFNYGQGGFPEGGAILDAQGNLYGTTYTGGASGDGVVYRLSPPAVPGSAWTYRVLHAFGPLSIGNSEGANPRGALSVRGKRILYGTVTRGGIYGGGTVFQLVPPAVAGGAWSENVLFSFGSATGDGGEPAANVVFDSAGNIYGTTTAGGTANRGTVFQLTPPASTGGDWTETILHSFGEGKDGSLPSGGLIPGKNGVLFGVTQSGGTNGEGAVYGVVK